MFFSQQPGGNFPSAIRFRNRPFQHIEAAVNESLRVKGNQGVTGSVSCEELCGSFASGDAGFREAHFLCCSNADCEEPFFLFSKKRKKGISVKNFLFSDR